MMKSKRWTILVRVSILTIAITGLLIVPGLWRIDVFAAYREWGLTCASIESDGSIKPDPTCDFRDKDIVTPAKDQGNCHESWAFAAVGALESRILMIGGPSYDLSEQQLISCSSDLYPDVRNPLLFWNEEGKEAMEEDCIPYNPTDDCRSVPCTSECTKKVPSRLVGAPNYVTDEHWYEYRYKDGIKESLAKNGPGYFSFERYQEFDNWWWGGEDSSEVYRYRYDFRYIETHNVLIIGWDDNKEAWLCKNSWGEETGPNGDGTFWIAYDEDNATALKFSMINVELYDPYNNPHDYENPNIDDGYECEEGHVYHNDDYWRVPSRSLFFKENTWLSNINGLGVQIDEDWYELMGSGSEERIMVDCRFTHAEGNIDIELYSVDLVPDPPREILLAYSASTTDNEFIDFTTQAGSHYYIRVSGDNTGNTYDLRWRRVNPSYRLIVEKDGTGTGDVTGDGISCGTDCTEEYEVGTEVTLTAVPYAGFVFSDWSGDCSGTNQQTTVTIDADKNCTATFSIPNPAGFYYEAAVQPDDPIWWQGENLHENPQVGDNPYWISGTFGWGRDFWLSHVSGFPIFEPEDHWYYMDVTIEDNVPDMFGYETDVANINVLFGLSEWDPIGYLDLELIYDDDAWSSSSLPFYLSMEGLLAGQITIRTLDNLNYIQADITNLKTIPEPATIVLLGSGILLLAGLRKLRRTAK